MLPWQAIPLLLFILSIVLFLNVRTPKFIGSLGEHEINHKLKRLDRVHYAYFSDLLLPNSGGKFPTTQIDHLVVSTYGIFCIETKTRSGVIVGSASDQDWTQIFPTKEHTFYNPIRQNYGHIKAVERIIGHHRKAPIVSLIAFPRAERLEVTGTDAVSDAKGTIAKLLRYQVPV